MPCSLIYTIADIYEDPQFAARDMLVQVPHPELGHTTQVGLVPKLSRTPGRIRGTGPMLGAQTDEVLQGLGLPAGEIDELRRQKVVGSG